MREAFAKADNVLATAAKCITDVINSTGQINVDFADVCTVMSNGGVAILGSAAAAGENRAQQAIEEALNSPLLNDNDIRGAKWILININSAEGEHEFTMDEVEMIQNYLLSKAGEDTDVILGLGYDNTLGDKIGITLIATGFEHKDRNATEKTSKLKYSKEEKIILTLGAAEDKKLYEQPVLPFEEKDPMAPQMVELPENNGIIHIEQKKQLIENQKDSKEILHLENTSLSSPSQIPTEKHIPELSISTSPLPEIQSEINNKIAK